MIGSVAFTPSTPSTPLRSTPPSPPIYIPGNVPRPSKIAMLTVGVPEPLKRKGLADKLATLRALKIRRLTFRYCWCRPKGKPNDLGHKLFRVSARICILSIIPVIGLSGTITVDADDNVQSSDIIIQTPWLMRKFATAIRKKFGIVLPRMSGSLSGVDEHNWLLFTGTAQGFGYQPEPSTYGVMAGEGYACTDGTPDFIDFVRVDGGYQQSLRYNGPFGGVREEFQRSPVDFVNLPLSLGALLSVGLGLPI